MNKKSKLGRPQVKDRVAKSIMINRELLPFLDGVNMSDVVNAGIILFRESVRDQVPLREAELHRMESLQAGEDEAILKGTHQK